VKCVIALIILYEAEGFISVCPELAQAFGRSNTFVVRSVMKASLLGLVVVFAVSANAQEKAPALAPVQLIPAAAVVKPSSDQESLRQLRQAEAELKAQKSAPVVVSPVLPNTSSSQQLPSIPRPVVAARPVVVARPALPMARPMVVARPRLQPVMATDAAGLLTARCLKAAHPLRCMSQQLEEAELRVDSAEVRLLNCRELRKFDTSLDKNVVDALVTGQMYQLRFKETQSFNAALAAMGPASKMKTKEAELRATLTHLNSVSALGSKVCNASAFASLYAAAQN
jgi:hypothetical protein